MKRGRVYPAEKDPRQQVNTNPRCKCGGPGMHTNSMDVWYCDPCGNGKPWYMTTVLSEEFGPWVRAADGSWMRRKARKR